MIDCLFYFQQLRTQLETALSEGLHLLLTDCDANTLMSNERLETVIRNQSRFASSEKPFKLQIGQQEIECSPKFRLYLHTVTSPVHIPKILAAYTLTLCFHVTLNDLEEIFLSRFMVKEKPHIDAEQHTLLQVSCPQIVRHPRCSRSVSLRRSIRKKFFC